MAPPKQKLLSRDEFLELIDDDDVAALWDKWQLAAGAEKSKKAPAFITAVSERANTTLLQDVLSLRTVTLQMLRDVLTFLSNQNSSVRTTGSLLVLDDEFDIAPQQVNAALKWSTAALRRQSSATWESRAKRLHAEIKPLFADIAYYGVVRNRRKQESLIKTALRMERGGAPKIRYTRIVSYDPDGLSVREEYGEKLKELNRKLAVLRDHATDAHAQELLSGIARFSREFQGALEEDQEYINAADREDKRSVVTDLTDKSYEVWKLFEEDVLFLADIEESASVVDLFRMDLFRKRPQLYEVWIVVAVIKFMRASGYKVEMLSLFTTNVDRIVWNLNYAKSQVPIARLVRARDGTEYFLFYQLFRSGVRRDEMPDLALLPSERPDDKPVWIMDPKHSERGSYSRSDYEEVGLRYHSVFSPIRTWIVEYYPRPDLGQDNPLVFAKDVELIRDVSPEGAGYKYLLDGLTEIHGNVGTTVAIVDVSGSFRGHLQSVIDDLNSLLAQGIVLDEVIIWFADKAVRTTGYLEALVENQGELQPPPDLGGATQFAQALQLAEALCKDAAAGVGSLRIYTDGQFDDVSLNEATNRLSQLADVKVIDFNSSASD